MSLIITIFILGLFNLSNGFQFLYGKHVPYGESAVSYIYSESYGTWKLIEDLQYVWNYYEQHETPTHPYNRSALIGAANGSATFTARDANGYLLCDRNDNLELDMEETNCGWAFHEHNARGVNNSNRGAPFTQFWLDDNWLARYMSQAYNRPSPSGLVDHVGSFMRWKAIAGDVINNGWTPYGSNFFDTLALDGLYYIARGELESAVGLWRASLRKSKAVWKEQRQVYEYPEVHENYHMGMWKIFTEQLIGSGPSLDSSLINLLIQHSVSQRVHILDNQEIDSSTGIRTGWISNIGQPSSLINTEGVSVNTLALGAHSRYVFEASASPMKIGTCNYYVRSTYVVSAVKGLSCSGHMSYGPYIKLPKGSLNIQFSLRSPHPLKGIARLEVYDSTEGLAVESHDVTAADFVGGANAWALISIQFLNSQPNHAYEFRTYWSGISNLDISFIRVL